MNEINSSVMLSWEDEFREELLIPEEAIIKVNKVRDLKTGDVLIKFNVSNIDDYTCERLQYINGRNTKLAKI